MVFTVDLRRHAHVRASLAHSFVSQTPKRCLEFCAAHIAGQFHATRISSRTK